MNHQKEERTMVTAIILILAIGAASCVAWRVFKEYEVATKAQERRLFEIQQKERAVEIERGLRLKKQERRAKEIRRLGTGLAKLHREFPSYAPSEEKYREYNRVMAEIREQKEREDAEKDGYPVEKYPTL